MDGSLKPAAQPPATVAYGGASTSAMISTLKKNVYMMKIHFVIGE